jgi:S1-C subfamily serine protease
VRRVIFFALVLFLGGCSGEPGHWGLPTPPPPPAPVPPSPLPPFDRDEDRIVQVVGRVSPAVVSVTSNLGSGSEGVEQGEGTGFIVDAGGVVVTNFHVVENGVNLRVVTANGDNLGARVIGGDPDADLAVLQVESDEPLPVVPLGSSGSLELGQPVVALGFALGLEGGPSVTSGIVSAMGRSIRAGGSGSPTRLYEGLIQTDAAINPGNSGGPLVDLDGRVVGINTAGVGAGAAENIGFAIAIDRARSVIEDAIRDPEAPQAYMGVSTRDITEAIAAQLGLPVTSGALVLEVVPGGPSDRAGIVPGDVITAIAGQEIGSPEDISEVLADLEPGQVIEVVAITPEGSEQSFELTLGTRALPVDRG